MPSSTSVEGGWIFSTVLASKSRVEGMFQVRRLAWDEGLNSGGDAMYNVLKGKAHRQVLSSRGGIGSAIKAHPNEERDGRSQVVKKGVHNGYC